MASVMDGQMLNGLLVIGALGAESGLLVLNRFILSAGVYKFPYPVALTLIQCIITYIFVLGAEYPFRILLSFLSPAEILGLPEPSQEALPLREDSLRPPPTRWSRGFSPRRFGFRRFGTSKGLWATIWTVLPLAIVYLLKVGLGNVFMLHLSLPAYTLVRIGGIPLLFAVNAALHNEAYSIFASCSAVLATSSLFLAILPFTEHIQLGNLILGVSLSIADALLPILLLNSCHERCDGLTSQGDFEESGEKQYIATSNTSRPRQGSPNLWSALRHASVLSTILLAPLVYFSGEWSHISKNSYVLDVHCLWQLLIFSGLLNGAHLVVTSILVMATSAVTTSLLAASSSAVLLAVFAFGSLTTYSWIGLTGCWLFSLFFFANQLKSGMVPELTSNRNVYSVLRSVIIILVLCVSIPSIGKLSWHHTQPPAIEVPSCASGVNLASESASSRPSKPSGTSNDGYLGPRPYVDTVANISSILDGCSEVADGLGVDDVINCLSFLANEQSQYLTLPEAGQGKRASEQNSQASASEVERSQKDLPLHYTEPLSAQVSSTANTSTCAGPVIPFHVYWTGPASWRFELFIKAYLYTQNLRCSRLWLWLDSDIDINAVDKMLCEDPIFQRFRPLISRGDIVLKAWRFPHRIPLPKDATENLTATSFHPHLAGNNLEMNIADYIVQDSTGKWLLLDPTSTAFSPVQVSDAVRFIVLHLHGGVYLDMDVLLLRDMRPLLLPNPDTGAVAFAEQWVERCPPSDYNTAVISVPANSSLSTYLLRGGVRMGMNFHPKVIGRMMWRDGRNDELKMLHNAVFDPLVTNLRRKGTDSCTVPCHKNFESAFMRNVDEPAGEWKAYAGEPGRVVEGTWPPTNRSLEHFFRGSWAYHIHNQWSKFPEPTSWMDMITRAQDGFFAGQRTNAYGEWWEGPPVFGYDRDAWS